MHEAAMAEAAIRIAVETAREYHLTRIQKIVVWQGEFSGILEDSFLFAFNQLKRYPSVASMMSEAEIELIHVNAEAKCQECFRTFPIERYNKRCPYCEGTKLSYADYYDFYVERIEGE